MKSWRIRTKTFLLILISIMLLTGCGGRSPGGTGPQLPYYDSQQDQQYTPQPQPYTKPGERSKVYIKNLYFRVEKNLGVNIEEISGELESKRPQDPVLFDDVRSFFFYLHKGKIVLKEPAINTLMNEYVLNYPNCPLSDIEVTFSPGKMKIKGKMKKIITIPFEMEGMSYPFNGLIKFVPDSIKAAGIPAKGLMDFLGMEVAGMMNINESRGIKIEGNSMIMDCKKMFPPPTLIGKVVGVELEEGKKILYFDDGVKLPTPKLPDPTAQNYMYVTGGTVKMMNELHTNTNLHMVDMDPSDPFDFCMKEYKRHLRAGYVKVMDDRGTLITSMPDYAKMDGSVQLPIQPFQNSR